MNLLQAIQTRRSVSKVADKPVDRNLIQQLLDYAAMAPNHKNTAPWRFRVFSADERFALATACATGDPDKTDFWREKVQRAPVIIGVASFAGRSKADIPVWEEHAATAAACQNMLLAAHALGLGAIWRSGKITEKAEVQNLFNGFDASKSDQVMAFIYIGWPLEN